MKAPFVWFGGKRRVASEVWDAFGDVDNYVEPFCGTLAVLLARPSWHRKHLSGAETVNDADQFVANFWRALAADPEAVAMHADWPVNEADLFARHLWLVNEGRARIAQMSVNPEWFDAKVAGWWVWGINAWIGSGWCSGTGPHTYETVGQLPHLGSAGRGVNRQLPHLGSAGQGVNRQLPHLGATPDRASTASVPTSATPDRIATFNELAERLRRVRVCCGDWARVVTEGAINYGATCGIFLDPPYLGDVRSADLYACDDLSIANDVREWAIANGDNPRLRICLAGYETEHAHLMPKTWRKHSYSASKSYGSSSGGGCNDANRHLERLWFSPHCLNDTASLFGEAS